MPKTTKESARERAPRSKAETNLSGSGQSPRPCGPEPDANRLLHELRVHQVELEMQNEELRHIRDALEFALSQYTDLYDFSPVSYFSLDRACPAKFFGLTVAAAPDFAVFPAFSITVPQMVTGDASGYTKSTRQRGLFVPFPPFTRLPVRIGKA